MAVETKRVTGRRTLHFDNLQDLLAEAERLAQSPVDSLGNWSLGQCYLHLAEAVNMALDGADFQAPWYIRLAAPLLKRRFLTRTMAPGIALPKNAKKLLPVDGVATHDGLAALRHAIERYSREPQRHPHPVFGPLSNAEWEQLQCRHAELHLGFHVPQP